ncbi:MAG TPA: S26 family signal peptidase [Sphingomonadaceae bacterium]|jgi:conjugative transfer signal peptidase TraF|nr:S26 family signal peptidase [Sphingomonadaceae bacterium]
MTTNAKPARPFAWGVLIAAQAAISIIAVTAVAEMPTRLVWNVSESVPTGLYAVRDDDRLRPGALAAVMPPEPLASWLVDGGYLGRGAPLLKRVEALPGQRVCRMGARVTVDGELRALAREADRFGRPLPYWSGCSVIADGQLFLLNADHPGSLDGRYFGPLPRTSVLGRAVPLLVDEAR